MNREEYQAYLASREWALLRERVRQRSGDRCERCYGGNQDAVHHMTYERIGNELLTDLLAICNECHEFLSGKSDLDPVSDVVVYLAGPITGNRWRDGIVADGVQLDHAFVSGHYNTPTVFEGGPWPVIMNCLIGGFGYSGPWFIDNTGHGFINDEPGTHAACGTHHDGPPRYRDEILKRCQNAITQCDIVFAWIPSLDDIPAGTIWELGYANAMDKPAFVHHPPEARLDDMWMALQAASSCRVAKTALDAWTDFRCNIWPQVHGRNIPKQFWSKIYPQAAEVAV